MGSKVLDTTERQKYTEGEIAANKKEFYRTAPSYLSQEEKDKMYAEFDRFEREQKTIQGDKFDATATNYLYGGQPGAADADVNRFRTIGGALRDRAAPQADYTNADQARGFGLQDRGDQQNAVSLYRDAAMGNGPSAAQSQFQQGLDASLRAQQSIANSARGGAMARSAARSEGAANAGDMSARATSMAAALRAQEMQSAMQGYAGASGQLRGSDLMAQGQDAQQAQFQAGMQLQSRGQNDQAGLGYEQLGQGARSMEMGGNAAMENAKAQRWMAQNGWANASTEAANQRESERQDRYIAAGAAVGSAAIASSDARGKKDVKPGDGKVKGFLDALQAHEYSYKDPARNGAGRHVSPMAQELEHAGPVGRSMVTDTPHGKVVDYGKGLGAMLAAQASLNTRIESLEKALASRKARTKAAA